MHAVNAPQNDYKRVRATPLFAQVRNQLRSAILEGEFQTGHAIPPEPALCERFEVSRITVRRAISELESDGLLEKVPGKGTFVRTRGFRNSLVSLAGFANNDETFRHGPRRTVLRKFEVDADPRLAALLDVAVGEAMYGLERVLYDGHEPLALDLVHYPVARVPGFLDHIEDDVSTFRVLKDYYGIEISGVSGLLRVGFADSNEARWLGCSLNDAVFNVDKILLSDGAPVGRSELAANPRRVSMRFEAGQQSAHASQAWVTDQVETVAKQRELVTEA